jgi:hypothetical protein
MVHQTLAIRKAIATIANSSARHTNSSGAAERLDACRVLLAAIEAALGLRIVTLLCLR